MPKVSVLLMTLAAIAGVALTSGCQSFAPKKEQIDYQAKLQELKVKPGKKKTVTIYQFRSSTPDLSADGATEMFMTAITKSNSFTLVERQSLASTVNREKSLQKTKKAAGNKVETKLTGADFIFEGNVAHFAPQETEQSTGINMAGFELRKGSSSGSISLDLRIIDTATGAVIDSVNAATEIETSDSGVSGVGSAIRNLYSGGHNVPEADIDLKKSQKANVEQALRQCIDKAVYELVKRYAAE